jgi:hypothetical protein
MNRLIVLFTLVFSIPELVLAQLQINESIVSASGSSSGTIFQTSWSIGEIFTDSFSNNNIKVNHGLNESGAVYIITGINEIEKGYQLYPNPFKSNLILEIPNEISGELSIEIFDLTGKNIPLEITKQQNQMIVSPGGITAGVYLFTVKDRNKTQSFKIIKK